MPFPHFIFPALPCPPLYVILYRGCGGFHPSGSVYDGYGYFIFKPRSDHLRYVIQDLMSRVSAREHDIIQVIHNSTSPIFAVNNMGYVNEWNYAMERLTGEANSDIVGKIAVGEVFGAKGILQTVPSKNSTDAATEMGALLVLALGDTQQDIGDASLNDINLSFFKRADATTDWSANAKQIDVSLYCRPAIWAERRGYRGVFLHAGPERAQCP